MGLAAFVVLVGVGVPPADFVGVALALLVAVAVAGTGVSVAGSDVGVSVTTGVADGVRFGVAVRTATPGVIDASAPGVSVAVAVRVVPSTADELLLLPPSAVVATNPTMNAKTISAAAAPANHSTCRRSQPPDPAP